MATDRLLQIGQRPLSQRVFVMRRRLRTQLLIDRRPGGGVRRSGLRQTTKDPRERISRQDAASAFP